MRNVGFVKVDFSDEECVVHIHGKGLRLEGETELAVYLFYEKGGECIGIPQGTIENVNPAVNYQLRFTKDDVGEACNYPLVEGIIMENSSHRKYAAVWDDMPVNVDAMRLWQESDRMERQEEPPTEEDLVNPEEEPNRLDETEPPETEPPETEPPETAPQETEPQETEPPAEAELPETEPQAQITAQQVEEPQPSAAVTEKTQYSGERVCHKIQRSDIAVLPRCEWRLSNNSFLLHGYYNYHHLLLIEENGRSWLGVPGIYHPKEARAAEAFGFPQFIKAEELGVSLNDEECNDNEEFGYWCRHVRR